MVKVKIKAFAILREELGWKENELMFDGDELKDLLYEIKIKGNGSLYDRIINHGKIISGFKILVNGRDIEFLKGLNTKLKESDEITLFPPVAGGRIGDSSYWRKEIANRWNVSMEEPCELCGAYRVQDGFVGYFELIKGEGYWVCPRCFRKEMTILKDKLYSRGCRFAYLINIKDNAKQVWKIIHTYPWIIEEKGKP